MGAKIIVPRSYSPAGTNKISPIYFILFLKEYDLTEMDFTKNNLLAVVALFLYISSVVHQKNDKFSKW